MSNELLLTIRELCDISDTQFVVPREATNSTSVMYRILKKSSARTNIPYGRKTVGGLTPYDGRHTVTTRLQRSREVPLPAVRDYVGHSDATMTYYYSHSSVEEMRTVAEVLERSFQQNGDARITGGF